MGDIGARAFHSATYVPKLGAVAIVGGTTSNIDGSLYRQKLCVTLINISTWSFTEYKVSDEICLSSTKMLLANPTTLLFFGGYTSKTPSAKPDLNCKSSYWGTVKFLRRDAHSELKVEWDGKPTKVGPFARGDAVQVGADVLVSCGTEQRWAVCTSVHPKKQTCDLLGCTANDLCEPPLAEFDKWIRYLFS